MTAAPRRAFPVKGQVHDPWWAPPAGAAVSAGGRIAAATLFLTDPVGPSALPGPDILEEGLGLSVTEAEVARLVAMGCGVGFVTRSLGVSLNTALTHLKSFYGKTGVSHQAALARTIVDRFPPVRGMKGRGEGEPRK
ncbi:hypothetical protein [Pararhodobacter sp. SW119]|uniref:helix-turn-helix transcriptional regulator n=1 Tax=Pararhodobacter sp. SW119 TaxID=2780075 RepID=UPI001AE0664E|nr:hypothetical protein [Pararhodobacter sp. SW119]